MVYAMKWHNISTKLSKAWYFRQYLCLQTMLVFITGQETFPCVLDYIHHLEPRLSQLKTESLTVFVLFQLIIKLGSTLPSNGTTFEHCGSQHLNILEKGEGVHTLLLVASSADGNFIPFQQVQAGATDQSIPSAHAPCMSDAALGCILEWKLPWSLPDVA